MRDMSGMGGMSGNGMSQSMMDKMMHMMKAMDMSHGYMMMQDMAMTFYTSTTTPLYSMTWMPMNTGAYAGTCIFLIVLSLILRALLAYRTLLEAKWTRKAFNRRYVVKADDSSEEEAAAEKAPSSGLTATLTTNGVSEKVKIIQGDNVLPDSSMRTPFRLSVDLPRALLVTVIVGVAYLLMLAVMTMNVGYYLSVLGGAFLGELLFGRYAHGVTETH